ncbi:AAA family ATPase [bacterium]|nr:AAA family ATPase [bacterium]
MKTGGEAIFAYVLPVLRRLTVEGFKSIGRELDIQLGKVNVFIGANGSGKSCILEALGILSAGAEGRIDDGHLLRRGVRPGVPRLYKSAFKKLRQRPCITLRAEFGPEGRQATYKLAIDNPMENPLDAWRYRSESLADKDWEYKNYSRSNRSKNLPVDSQTGLTGRCATDPAMNEPVRNSIQSLIDYAIFSPNTQTLRGLVPDLYQRQPIGLSGGRLPEAYGEMLRFQRQEDEDCENLEEFLSLVDWMSGLRVTNPSRHILSPNVPAPVRVLEFRDRYLLPNSNRLLAHDVSEGALYVLSLAIFALHPQTPAILAIDNFDQALNPRLARSLMTLYCQQVMKRKGVAQTFFTTHNPAVLDGLDISNDEVRLFAVDRDSNGMTTATRILLSEELISEAKSGMTLSRLWVSGRLGGVPDL